jgi:hypothetical protein
MRRRARERGEARTAFARQRTPSSHGYPRIQTQRERLSAASTITPPPAGRAIEF